LEDRLRSVSIGFSQRIQLDWLELTAQLVLAGYNREALRKELQYRLKDKLSVGDDLDVPKKADGSSRAKAIRVLLRTWETVPPGLGPFRDDGLRLIQGLPTADHLAIHWGMILAVFPFFAAVAEATGRLDRLQGSVTAKQVQRRVSEQFGERETIARAARRILSCYFDWGILCPTSEKGVYKAVLPRPVNDNTSAAWLVEATLIGSSSQSGTLGALSQSPSLFPFALARPIAITTPRLEVFRQGLDEDVVTRRELAVGLR